MHRVTPIGQALACMLVVCASFTRADVIDLTITADNAYGVYHGSLTTVSAFHGWSENSLAGAIGVAENYVFNAPSTEYIYIAGWSDDLVRNGMLLELHNLTTGATVLSGDPLWEVTATGINLDSTIEATLTNPLIPGDPPPTIGDLQTQVLIANAGTNPSNGWTSISVSPFPNVLNPTGPEGIHTPYIDVPLVDDAAYWMWYDNGNDPNATLPNPPFYPGTPFWGFDHDEYLIFRIPVSSIVPLPSSAAMGFAALLGLVIVRGRRKRSFA